MRYLIVFILLSVFVGCFEPQPATENQLSKGQYPAGVERFDDGDIICYVYFQHAISCVLKRSERETIYRFKP